MSETPTLSDAEILSLQKIEAAPRQSMPPMKPMKPMKLMQPMQPMQPMKMGDMEMSMNPMQMRMGNMSMAMGSTSSTTSGKSFCPQCGVTVQPSDRFCSSCVHQL